MILRLVSHSRLLLHRNILYRNPDEDTRYLSSANLSRLQCRQCILQHVEGAGERAFDPDTDLHDGGLTLQLADGFGRKEATTRG